MRGMLKAQAREIKRLRRYKERYERLRIERKGGSCICVVPGNIDIENQSIIQIKPECTYHKAAAAHPQDHSIPWNCPTYWDGCNCKRVIDKLNKELAERKEL
jgi:hypothetical protein